MSPDELIARKLWNAGLQGPMKNYAFAYTSCSLPCKLRCSEAASFMDVNLKRQKLEERFLFDIAEDSSSEVGKPAGASFESFKAKHSADHRILTVGEGNFSFTLSLVRELKAGQNIVATSLDTLAQLKEKYASHGVDATLRELSFWGVNCIHGIDATQLDTHLEPHLAAADNFSFHRIIFNFPHGGKSKKMGEQARQSIVEHKSLMGPFFLCAATLLNADGVIMVTCLTDHYGRWNLGEYAQRACLELRAVVPFEKKDYPAYRWVWGDVRMNHSKIKQTTFDTTHAAVFIFGRRRAAKSRHIHSGRINSSPTLKDADISSTKGKVRQLVALGYDQELAFATLVQTDGSLENAQAILQLITQQS
eukprot:g47755.t1